MSFVQKIHKTVRSLEEAGIFINHFVLVKPDPGSISSVESTLGYKLDDAIRDFYSECDGLQLIWTHKSNPDFEKLKKLSGLNEPLPHDWAYEDYHRFDGVIMLSPLKDIFSTNVFEVVHAMLSQEKKQEYLDKYSQMKMSFMGKEYSVYDFDTRVRSVDIFSKYNEMVFFTDGTANPPLLLADDHQACFTDSKLIRFSDYMEFLLYCKGSVKARPNFFYHCEGHDSPKISRADIAALPPIDLLNYGKEGMIIPFKKGFWS